jgi:hypothetical protein
MRRYEWKHDAGDRLGRVSGLFGNRMDKFCQLWAVRRSRLAICPRAASLTPGTCRNTNDRKNRTARQGEQNVR